MIPRTMVQHKLLKNFTSCVKLWMKKSDVMEIGEEQYILIEKPRALQQNLMRRGKKLIKENKLIQHKIIKNYRIQHKIIIHERIKHTRIKHKRIQLLILMGFLEPCRNILSIDS